MAATEQQAALDRFVRLLRAFLRDYPELNRLIDGEESSDRFLAFAVLDALDDYNSTPPVTRKTLDAMPTSLLIRGAAISVLESVGLLQTRNQLNYRDGDGILPTSDHAPLLMSWLQMLTNKYEQKKKSLKVAQNIENAWGDGVSSEYSWISQVFGSW